MSKLSLLPNSGRALRLALAQTLSLRHLEGQTAREGTSAIVVMATALARFGPVTSEPG